MAHIPSTNHELALFSLVPINDSAKGVLGYFGNRRLLSLLRDPENPVRVRQALNVGFNVDSKTKTRGTLATIGRAGDIIIPDDRISRIQCSFEINVQSQEVMLYDRSTLHTTSVRGPDAHDFSPGLPRKVLVAPGLNTEIWLGEEYSFALHWHKHALDIGAELELFQEDLLQRLTIEAASPARDTVSRHALPDLKPNIRFQRRKALGSGSFGKVYKAANIDTGDLFAVKLVYIPDRARKPRNYAQVMREVETLARSSHPNIVDYLFAQRNDNYLEICMGLYQGSVEALVARNLFEGDVDLTLNLLHQMLMALDYLAVNEWTNA
ncbi:putative calcium calmodulin-dependent protein kinase protein [Neofusicoccum parvum UCRNP2]|uniref:mitogen-activated protein kinase n=1 Tax=Botryosphaeria parva (strain UCR-NP2) TaxID=1287680 RepID=R1GKR2_BOTPV|nr:putative calcium calmodulin-dependent protein kinase protein [Neofusicoccum parvum UCRNP2]